MNSPLEEADASSGPLHQQPAERMLTLIEQKDWAATPLGPLHAWPASLRNAVQTILHSRFPMFLWWGPGLINIYNDAYAPMLGKRHPSALGLPASLVWKEVWPMIGPEVEQVMATGQASWHDRSSVLIERNGYSEEALFTWSHSPLFDDHGTIAGILCVCMEETSRVRLECERDQLLKQVQTERTRLAEAFSQSPAFLALLQGPTFRFEFVNDRYKELLGDRPLVGKTVRDAIPEVEEQGYLEILERVYSTGEPFIGTDMPLQLQRGQGQPLEQIYLDFVYQPMRGSGGNVTGILVHGVEVTARRTAERTLREREERYRHFVQLSSEGIWRFETDQPVPVDLPVEQQLAAIFKHAYLAECNDAMARMYGFTSASDLQGFRLHQLHDPTRPQNRLLLENFVRNNYRVQDVESEEVDRHGQRRSFLNSFVGWVEDGCLVRAWGILRDITEQRKAQEALRASEAAFRQLADAMPQIVFSATPDGHVDYFNRQWYQYTGLPEGAVGYESWKAIHTPEGLERVRQVWPTALKTGQPYEIEYLLRRHDGEYRWHLGRALPIKDADGTILRWYGTNTDIHDRKTAEAALRVSDERLRMAQRAGRVGVFEWDIATDQVYRSPELEELYDAPIGSMSGPRWNWHRRVLPEDAARIDAALDEALRQQSPKFAFEFRVRLRNGDVRWLAGNADISYDAQGKPLRVIGVNLDISERKANEAAREQLLAAERAARAEAERASDAKSEFLATLSHELRTPLTPVLLTVSLLESHPDLPADLRDDVTTIRRNVELESRLISDLLDLTRISRGKLQLESQDLDLHLLLRTAIDICRRESSATLVAHLDAAHHTVHGDSMRLQQIFWNLITNAQKFTPADGSITLRTSNLGDIIRVEISDTGVGIDADVLPRLFNAFEQGNARSIRQQAGLGLGLAISRKLAEAHGGQVNAASAGPGKGATFTVDLPLVNRFAPERTAPGTLPVTAPARCLAILLVEDHEATLRILSRLLTHLGHTVTTAASIQEALVQAGKTSYDLLISDIGLPDGSGFDLARQLPQFANRSIALTGYGMETDIAASRAAGFARHLTKPVDLRHLQETIGALVVS